MNKRFHFHLVNVPCILSLRRGTLTERYMYVTTSRWFVLSIYIPNSWRMRDFAIYEPRENELLFRETIPFRISPTKRAPVIKIAREDVRHVVADVPSAFVSRVMSG